MSIGIRGYKGSDKGEFDPGPLILIVIAVVWVVWHIAYTIWAGK